MSKNVKLIKANWRELECQKVSVKIKGRRKIGEVYCISFLSGFWGKRWLFRPLHGNKDIIIYETFDTSIDECQKAREYIVDAYQIVKSQ